MHKKECICRDCGKKFNFGDEGDNEKFCLRCTSAFFNRVDGETNDNSRWSNESSNEYQNPLKNEIWE